MRRGARTVLIVLGAVAIAAAGFWLLDGDMSAAAKTGTSGGIEHREALVALLTLGIIAIALYGFDLRDWI